MPKTSVEYCTGTDDHARQWDHRAGCEVRTVLDRVSDKWSLLALSYLSERSHRFSELRRKIDGVSQRMMTVTLRQLERDGLVLRTVHPTVPPRVDYELTPLGANLHQTIQVLSSWSEQHEAEIAAARAAYDARISAVSA
ncbi:transcriptional regulator [Saccharothrix sp. ALI-22-I]|uniref:winged helix-turn-helix transcriptional regulator n=1 Tax=Saccharothrix sp. ALI-22-I TaxID=1933778 RepID=UPI00097C06A9|nr:helix-turn-helix domain-containing protein [Saccharothrix sp. ALI-22-I]ONI84051.1 transcriptional regulator [Saccharothrix sp. ALI-22-I]